MDFTIVLDAKTRLVNIDNEEQKALMIFRLLNNIYISVDSFITSNKMYNQIQDIISKRLLK
jgi:hypothetical protein